MLLNKHYMHRNMLYNIAVISEFFLMTLCRHTYMCTAVITILTDLQMLMIKYLA